MKQIACQKQVLNQDECINALKIVLADPGLRKKTAVYALELEDFKQFNSTFGYAYGDLLIAEIQNYLAGFDGVEVFRVSGVGFVLIKRATSYTQADEVAAEIAQRFNDIWHIREMDCVCAMNLGALYPTLQEESPESALEKLDAALHESMTCGQNTPVVFDEELGEMLQRTKLLANQLRDALVSPTDSALEVCFRPTVRTSNGVPVRAEAYLRMYSAEYGMIGAATLLPIAEETGIACALNLFMLRAACVMARTLLNAGCVFESISVPLSAVQFLQKGFCTELSALLKEYEIPANKLALEITESTLINSFAQISETLGEIAALDMETSLSDFGTGYSGVSNILNLPVATLKLDRLFVFQMVEDARCCGVIEGLISIAHKLGMKVIAEGVENEFQKDALTRYGCDYQQGFYYSATLPPPELLALFQEQLK